MVKSRFRRRRSPPEDWDFPCLGVARDFTAPNNQPYVVLFSAYGVGANLHDGQHYINRNMTLYRPYNGKVTLHAS